MGITDIANTSQVALDGAATSINNLMGSLAKGSATIYDKAMDAKYIATHIGGGNHRLFDGSHTLWGSWKACRDASNDSLPEKVGGWIEAVWKDMTTTKGIPIAT